MAEFHLTILFSATNPAKNDNSFIFITTFREFHLTVLFSVTHPGKNDNSFIFIN